MLLNSHYKRAIILLVLAMLMLGMAFGVAAQTPGGTLRVGMNAPGQSLDPASNPNDPETLFNRSIYDFLIETLPDGTLAPNLATAWEISDDGLTYTFTLTEVVTFHDGSAFSSADVVYTFNRLKTVESPALGLLGTDFEVSAPDATTVVFTLTAPNADFGYGIGSRWTGILKDGTTEPNVIVEGDNPYVNFNGTGPFALSDYQPGQRAVFVRNENYWIEGQPYLDGLEFIYFADTESESNALRSGEVDYIFKLSIDDAANLEGTDGVSIIEKPTNLHPVIRLRADEGSVGSDVRVRQALKLATDRDALNDLLMDGRAVVGNNDPIGPLYGPFYAADLAKPVYDPAAACSLVNEAGYDRLALTFYVVDAFNYADLATVLQQQWREGCIDVEIEVQPENVYYGDNGWMEVELGLTGWGSRPIPQQYLLEAYQSTGIYNESHWANAQLDALIAEASVTSDTAARAAIYNQISQIFADEGPIIIPWFSPMLGAARDNVQGLDMNPFPGLTDFRMVSLG